MDMFSTDVLNRVVQSLKGGSQFLLDRYFSTIQTETSEEIHFDTMDGKRRIAPFVSPLVEGQIVASPGFKTSTLKPAYTKDKRVFDMNKPLKRAPGENFGGTMSPMARLQAMIARDEMDQLDMLRRRLEVMSAEVLLTGKLIISGEKYPTVLLDFGRATSNTVIANPLWSAPAATPLVDLTNWAQTGLQSEGVLMTDVIMTTDVWQFFRLAPSVQEQLNLYRNMSAPPSLTGETVIAEGGYYMGNVAGFNIYVYAGWYVDPADGVEKPILPVGTVLMTSPALDGVQAYGAIRDEEAGLQALPYFVKSWIEKDPSVRFLLMQSAPLIFPTRPNASFKARVL